MDSNSGTSHYSKNGNDDNPLQWRYRLVLHQGTIYRRPLIARKLDKDKFSIRTASLFPLFYEDITNKIILGSKDIKIYSL